MLTFPALRPRFGNREGATTTGAISRVRAGLFGVGAPVPQDVRGDSSDGGVANNYHAGDIFLPGAEGYVFESAFELPIKSIWGGGSGVNQGTLYPVNAWPVFGPPQVFAEKVVPTAGLGGLQAGAFAQQPLMDEDAI